jgi:hypothetical protein
VHFVLQLTLQGTAFIASRTCQLPSLPPPGSVIAVSLDRSLRPEVEEVTCWLDGYAGVRLGELECFGEETLTALEAHGWAIESLLELEPLDLLPD